MNKKVAEGNRKTRARLTVTKVVFESIGTLGISGHGKRLTVTKVVFELKGGYKMLYEYPGLTVTKVVFEFTKIPFRFHLPKKINSNKGCF